VAEPTNPQRKLAQALGLAIAAPVALDKVAEAVEDEELREVLDRMRHEATEARDRCLEAAAGWGAESREEIVSLSHDFSDKAGETVRAWIRPATGELERFEVLAMLETGEVAAWQSLALVGARVPALVRLAEWGLPVQERHLVDALQAARKLAVLRDAAEATAPFRRESSITRERSAHGR
jgi:hypothetical protein